MTGLQTRARRGVEWLEADGDGWRAVFSTRHGGVSRGPFATLDLSYAVGDAPERVSENRRRLATAAGFDGGALVVGRQVHGTRIAAITARDRGRGAAGQPDAIADVDGLLTGEPGLPLMVTVADCVPVVVVAAGRDGALQVAALHAGWRALLTGILERGVERLRSHGSIVAAVVGPSIGPCCFTVGEEVGRAYQQRYPGTWRDDRVDLWTAAARQLAGAGVAASRLSVAHVCTSCDRRFFSHRRDAGRSGRQAGIVWIEGGFPTAGDDS